MATRVSIPAVDLMERQVTNPYVPTTAALNPSMLGTPAVESGTISQQDKYLQGDWGYSPEFYNSQMQTNAQNAAFNQANAQNATGQLQNTPQVQTAFVGDNAPQAEAAQGTVSEQATVQGQLASMYAEYDPANPPPWAKGKVAQANDALAAAGLGTSTIAGTAMVQAVNEAALPIAAQDASTYFQMDVANLSNRQQTSLENLRVRQQAMLTDIAAENVSRQINASNEIDVKKFQANLIKDIDTFNANLRQTTENFNRQIDLDQQKYNSTQKMELFKFTSEGQNQREQFNSQMRYAIDSSNVLWRRSVSTADNAAINTALQLESERRFAASSTAINNLWQQWRDEASWAYQSSENAQTRAYNLAVAANDRREIAKQIEDSRDLDYAKAAGRFITSIITD